MGTFMSNQLSRGYNANGYMTSTVVWVCQEIMGIYHQFMASLKRKDSGHMFLGRGQVGRPSSGAVPVDTYQSDQLRIKVP